MQQALRTTVILASLTATLSWGLPAVASASDPAPEAVAGPRLVVEEPTVDLGEVVKGSHVTHSFVLRNEGSEPLRLLEVNSSCGCTVAEFDEVIAPGGQGTVRTELNSLSLTGVGSTFIKVDSNDPQAPQISLELKFNVVDLIRATPGFARWLMTRGEADGSVGQTVWTSDGQELRVVAVETPSPFIHASFRPATEEERYDKATGAQWRVELTLDGDAPVGAITGEALVRLEHPRQKVLPIPVSGFVRPTVFVEPASGDFGTLRLEAPKKAVYSFRNFATEPISIVGVEPNVEGLAATVETVELGRRYRVVLEFDPAQMPAGPFQGTMVIRTDSKKVPSYEMELKGTLIDARNERADGASSHAASTPESLAKSDG